jgi:hypothetical protein
MSKKLIMKVVVPLTDSNIGHLLWFTGKAKKKNFSQCLEYYLPEILKNSVIGPSLAKVTINRHFDENKNSGEIVLRLAVPLTSENENDLERLGEEIPALIGNSSLDLEGVTTSDF